MAEHSFYGKKRLCYTEVTDFRDFQGIGNDPMYKRFDSVYSVIDKVIDVEYKHFLAQPSYSDEDQIYWFVKEWNEVPARFTDLEGDIKSHYQAIKDRTLKHYNDVLASIKGEDRQILSGALRYIHDDFIFCYDDKVIAVAWGMTPDSNQHKVTGAIIKDLQFESKYKVRFDVGENGSLPLKIDAVISRASGATLGSIDIPSVTAAEGWDFVRWEPEPIGHKVTKNVTFKAIYKELPKVEATPQNQPTEENEETVRVVFDAGGNGELIGDSSIELSKGQLVPAYLVPQVNANGGFTFIGWNRSIDEAIENDTIFEAQYERKSMNCRFIPGEEGILTGHSDFNVPYGSYLMEDQIPSIESKDGYKFVGWDHSTSSPINTNTTFRAQYEKIKLPWYVRLKNWFRDFWNKLREKGCLKKLLWLLLVLLLLLLLSSLLKTCRGGHNGSSNGNGGYVGNPETDVAPIERVEREDGSFSDDNGVAHEIVGEDGRLPDDISDHSIVAPITDEDGQCPPVISNPGAPDIISNRLNIYFEDDDVDLNQFALDFKRIYPGADYKIIGADDNVKAVQIQIPEEKRNQIRETINSRLPEYKFFVVDESIFTLVGKPSRSENNGWHLKAINLKDAWNITKGDKDIVVAVVDDGIDASHSMFKGRIYYPYNVFTQNNRLSVGEGHGTHVAALAVGSDDYYSQGVAGVAPKCKLMPIQVFDNEQCTFSSVTSGIMYAIHHGADVINVSIGPRFNGLNVLPPSDQLLISETQFKNEEKVFRKIFDIAKKNNTIIVFAAGNDDILAKVAPENRTNYTINVSAVDQKFSVTEFSNYGMGTNISAPGEAIYSAYPTNTFATFDGTSMAAPIVSGTVALLKSVNKDLTVAEILAILQQSGKKVTGNIPPMVQVDRALQLAKTGNFTTPSSSGNDMPSGTFDDSNPNHINAPGNENYDNGGAGNGNSDYVNSPDVDNGSGYTPGNGSHNNSQTDYDAIRRMIEEYKRKIAELEKLLPENKK